jgi:PPP family 3-phenylpropionic acid transporter
MQSAASMPERQRALTLLGAVYFAHFASAGIHLPLAAKALSWLGLTPALIGTCFAMRSVASMLAPPLWGNVADRAGSARGAMVAALGLGGACFVGLALAQSGAFAIGLSVLWGVVGGSASGIIDGAVLTALGNDRRRFGPLRAIGTVGFGITAIGAGLLLGAGIVHATPFTVFGGAALPALVGAGIAYMTPDVPRPRLEHTRQLSALSSPGFLLLAAIAGLQWSSHGAHTGFLVPLAEAQGFSPTHAGIAIGLGITVEVISMRAAAKLLERYSGRTLLIIITVITVFRWLGLSVTPGLFAFYALHALHGVSFGLFFPVLVPMVASLTQAEIRQSAQGLLLTAFSIGGALGSLVAGWAFEVGGPQLVWQSMALLACLAVVLTLFLPRPAARAA